jgi:phosphoglycolate phosphatase-like HAD superfamily hydrolase
VIEAVVFDLDGVVVDSEQVWDDVRERLAQERGGRWHDRAQADMMGMSSPEWSRYMHDELGLAESPEEINDEVVRRMLERYRTELPLIEGAVEAVERLAGGFRLAVASSSNRPLIEAVLETAGIAGRFEAVVSSGRWRVASRRRTSTSRRQGGSVSRPRARPRSRTPRTGSAPRTRRACASSRSRTRTTRPRRTRSRSPTPSSPRRTS